jgi:hypothetical protein
MADLVPIADTLLLGLLWFGFILACKSGVSITLF